MLKILRRFGSEDGEYLIKYEVSQTSTSVTVKIVSAMQLENDSITFDLREDRGKVLEVAAMAALNGHKLVVYPLYQTSAFGTPMPNRAFSASEKRLFRIAIDDDVVIQLMLQSPEIKGFENIVMDKAVSLPEQLSEHSALAKTYIDKVVRKSNLLSQLDNGNSIAYLEAQVDVLTRYVLHLHKDDENIAPELRAVLEAADKHSVLDIKAQDKLLKEMEHKAHTREEQLKYYGS